MICHVCCGERFIAGEYRTEHLTAPALECESCGALNLDESAGHSDEERRSIRLAKAARASTQPPPPSTPQPPDTP